MRSLQQWFDHLEEGMYFNTEQRTLFYKDTARFMAAGVPFSDVLSKLVAVAKRGKNRPAARIYGRMFDAVDSGISPASTMACEIPNDEAAPLVSAEAGGDDVLRVTLAETAKLMERKAAIRSALLGLVGGVIASIVLILGLLVVLMVFVVPQLEKMLGKQYQGQLGFAGLYFAFGNWFIVYSAPLGVLAAGLWAWSLWSLPRWHVDRRYWSRTWCDRHVPPWSLYVRAQAATFLSTLASLVRADIPLQDGLEGMLSYSSPWMKNHLSRILDQLRVGADVVTALSNSFLPRDVTDRLSVYALVPDVTEALTDLAEHNFEVYQRRLQKTGSTVSAVRLALLSIFIVATLFAIFTFVQVIRSSASMPG